MLNPMEIINRRKENKEAEAQFQAAFQMKMADRNLQRQALTNEKAQQRLAHQAAQEATKGPIADKEKLRQLVAQASQLKATHRDIRSAQGTLIRCEGTLERAKVKRQVGSVVGQLMPVVEMVASSVKSPASLAVMAGKLGEMEEKLNAMNVALDDAMDAAMPEGVDDKAPWSREEQDLLAEMVEAGRAASSATAAGAEGDVTDAEIDRFLEECKERAESGA